MSLKQKYAKRIVKVMVPLSEKPLEATIYEKGKKPVRQFLNGDTRHQLDGDLFGYFEADKIGEVYYIGDRQFGGWRW